MKRFALPLILTIFTALAIGYSIVIPLGEAPDEVSHFAYVQYLIAHHQLPPSEGMVAGEAHQPPLYYMIGALATFWIDQSGFIPIANPDWRLDDPTVPNVLLHTRQEGFPYQGGALAWHLIRLLSIAMGAVTVWATYQLAQTIFATDQTVAIVSAGFVAFLPSFTSLSAVINNDNFVIMFATLTLLFFARRAHSANRIDLIVLGILLGLSVLAKLSSLPLWVVIAAGVLLVHRDVTWRTRLGEIVLTFATATFVILPWIAYTAIGYDDPLNWGRFAQVSPRSEPLAWNDWLRYATQMYESFWGKFGGASHLRLPFAVYVILGVGLVVGLIGTARLIRNWRAGGLPSLSQQLLVLFGLLWILQLAAHIRLMISTEGMDLARHVFVALPSFVIVVSAGILSWLPQHAKSIAWVVGLGTLVTASGGLAFVHSSYDSTNLFPPVTLSSAQPNTPADFGRQIRLLNYSIVPMLASHSYEVTLEWQSLDNLSENYWLLLQLNGSNGVMLQKDGVPGNGRQTTDWWQAGQIFSSRHRLTLANNTPPGSYMLRLGLHPFGSWDWLDVNGREMINLGTIRIE